GVGQVLEARKHFEKALRVAEEAAKVHPGTASIILDVAHLRLRMGEVSEELGDPNAARGWFELARAQAESMLRREPKSTGGLLLLAHAHGKLYEANVAAGVAGATCFAEADRSRAIFEDLDAALPGSYNKELGLAYLRLTEYALKSNDMAAAHEWAARSYAAY